MKTLLDYCHAPLFAIDVFLKERFGITPESENYLSASESLEKEIRNHVESAIEAWKP